MFRAMSCPCCCIAKSSPDDHYMSNCKTLKRCGYTVTYNFAMDERRPAYEKEKEQRQRNAEKEKEDAEKAEKQKKAAAAKKKADEAKRKAAAAKKKKEEEENNGDDDDSATQAGTARRGRHLHANRFGPLATDTDSDSEPQLLVDSSTACNTINNPNSTEYTDIYIYNGLRKFDRDGKRCISVAKHHCRKVDSNRSSRHVRKHIIPDSGATSHMRIHKHDFEPGSYVSCSDVFVLMGDGSEVPVAGYGV